MQSLQMIECAAACSRSTIVYGYDENGQEIPIRILVDGPFNSDEEKSQCPPPDASFNDNISWLGSQEECISCEQKVSVESNVCKAEIKEEDPGGSLLSESLCEDLPNKSESMIKVYKVHSKNKKTLKGIREQLKQKRILGKMTKTKIEKFGQCSKRFRQKVQKQMSRGVKRTKYDKCFSPPAYVAKNKCEGEYFDNDKYDSTCNQLQIFRNVCCVFFCSSNVRRSQRIKWTPTRFKIYWGMNIPTEFYEDDFLEFERNMFLAGDKKEATVAKPHANSEYTLAMFKLFENRMRKKNKKIYGERLKYTKGKLFKGGKNLLKKKLHRSSGNIRQGIHMVF